MSTERREPVQTVSEQRSADQSSPQPNGLACPPGPAKLSLVVYSGNFHRVHYALVMASAAAAVGTPATLFFTMEAARFLAKPRTDGTPGWRNLPADLAAGNAADVPSAGAVDDDYARRGVASLEELLLACAAFGVTFMVCEMGLKVIGLEAAALRADLNIAEGGVVSFLADASAQGTMLFI